MVVLITGATGLVGSKICGYFLSQNFRVKALVRKNANTELINNILPKIEIVDGDILDIFSIENALEGVDYVVHAAAMVSFSPKDADAMFKINVEGTANLVNCCLSHGKIKKYCQISSIASLGRPSDFWQYPHQAITIDETQKWEESDLNSNYAKSKFLAECEVYRAAAEGLDTVILNPTIILGEGDWNKSSTQLFKYVFDKKPFYTAGYINYVDVNDVAELTYKLTLSDIVNERFAITAGNIAFKEVFEKMAKNFGISAPKYKLKPWLIAIIWRFEAVKSMIFKTTPLITKETAKTSQLNILYANAKIKKAIGFEFTPIDETINRVCDFFINKNLAQKA